jgi:hypothetical protein
MATVEHQEELDSPGNARGEFSNLVVEEIRLGIVPIHVV